MLLFFKLLVTVITLWVMLNFVGAPLTYILLQVLFLVSFYKLMQSILTVIDVSMKEGK